MVQVPIRIALAQMNSSIGAFEKNAERILAFTAKAAQEKARLVLFPELALSSYPCLDLLDREDFREAHGRALGRLIAALKGVQGDTTVVFGAFTDNPDGKGRLLQNAAVVVEKGEAVYTQSKQLLPTYDVFDENRHFEPGTKAVPWSGSLGAMGISVCEDAWFEELHTGRSLYDEDPAKGLKGAAFAVNLSASPFTFGKQQARSLHLSSFAKKVGAPLLYVNQVGANDEILFDGDSRIFDGSGELLLVAPSFQEGLVVTDFDPAAGVVKDPKFFLVEGRVLEPVVGWQNAPALLKLAESTQWSGDPSVTRPKLQLVTPGMAPPQPSGPKTGPLVARSTKESLEEMRIVAYGLQAGIRDYFAKTGFTQAIIGLSGGIDSAVVATLAARALGPDNVYGVSMPSKFSSTGSLEDAQALADNLGILYGAASIKFVNSALLMELKTHFRGAPEDETEENLQSRLRGTILMAIANKRKALVLTTGNKSELAVGYCTLYGDMCGAIAPLGDLYKTKVYELAKVLNEEGDVIPRSSIEKPPSAELRPGQTDQDSLPPYELLDALLQMHLEEGLGIEALVQHGYDEAVVKKILRLVKISEFKRRQAAPVLKVTPKAFGLGRRYPVARGF